MAKYVNAKQSKEDRKTKYAYVKALTNSSNLARNLRDWHWCYINRFLHHNLWRYVEQDNLITTKEQCLNNTLI